MLAKIFMALCVIEFGILVYMFFWFKKHDDTELRLLKMWHDANDDCNKLAESLNEEIAFHKSAMPVIRELYVYLWGHTYDTEAELKRMGLDDNPLILEVAKDYDASNGE